MNKLLKITLSLSALVLTLPAIAQTNNDAHALVEDGIKLFDAGKYPEAIEKYQAALKIKPDDYQADYELGYTLYASGKPDEAIPYLEKILKSDKSKYETYEVLGSIYDDTSRPEKAIECYKAGIKEKPDFERLHFNLGLTYYRQKQFAEALDCATTALKLDPKHSSAHWLYGLAANAQNQQLGAVMAFCNFLILEPNSKRSVQVNGYINGILSQSEAQKNIVITPGDIAGGNSVGLVAATAVNICASTKDQLIKQGLDTLDATSMALKIMFNAIGKASAGPNVKKTFFLSFYADYFGQLAASDNMPAFVHYITFSIYREKNGEWLKTHQTEVTNLDAWLKKTDHKLQAD